jgi:murein DD-endopeptidase MepM/ murein hydrolase activator NlpD
MGNHRADRRGSSRRPSDLPTPIEAAGTAGKRRAEKPARPEAAAPVAKAAARVAAAPAKAARAASRHASSRGALFRVLPSPPILLGVAALAISAGGAVTATHGGLGSAEDSPRLSQASALSGASDVSRVSMLDRRTVSRDSRRDALADAADADLVAEAEDQLEQRNAALAKFAQQAEQQAAKLRLNQWVLPVSGYHLTAGFGESSGLWAHYHTGLDFAAPSGTEIHAIANGVVTSVGYDGSYGNKTVITLDDGTELWFCHQTSYAVSVGQAVQGGDLIGYVGSTGNVTGPHLHLEVRPGAGDPVDPYEALVVHGLTP